MQQIVRMFRASRKQHRNVVVHYSNLPTTSFLSFIIELVILRERRVQQRGAFLLFKNALVTLEPAKNIQAFDHSGPTQEHSQNVFKQNDWDVTPICRMSWKHKHSVTPLHDHKTAAIHVSLTLFREPPDLNNLDPYRTKDSWLKMTNSVDYIVKHIIQTGQILYHQRTLHVSVNKTLKNK